MRKVSTVILWLVALFYLYGAAVHVMNMLSLTGFDWGSAPGKWQALDIVYLILDVMVVIGFFTGWKPGHVAFYVAAVSQIILYTLFRPWVVDVPAEFAVSPEQQAYLTTLVIFHVVTLVVVTGALYFRKQSSESVDGATE